MAIGADRQLKTRNDTTPMQLKFPDGNVRDYPDGASPFDVAESISKSLSKKALAASLDEAGVAYVHLKPLGTPKAGREAARKGDTKTMQRIYEARLAEPESQLALAEAAELAGKGRTCLMCLEHDWRVCHRAIVAKELAKGYGLAPVHLSPEPEV